MSLLSPEKAEADASPCPDCERAQGLCRRHAKGVLPQLAQPHWYRLVGTHYVDLQREALRGMSPEARAVFERKQRKAQTKAACAARMANARAGIREALMRELEQASLLRTLMDEPPAAA